MPKLSTELAAQVDKAEGGNFDPLPEDVYQAVLDGEVEVQEGPKGPYWKWVFKIAEGEFSGRKLFLNTGLSENAQWRLNEVFKAFGVPTDTDTDDLIGQSVKLYVVQKPIGGNGPRAGEMGNEIRNVLPLQDDDAEPAAPQAQGAKARKSSPKKPDAVPLY